MVATGGREAAWPSGLRSVAVGETSAFFRLGSLTRMFEINGRLAASVLCRNGGWRASRRTGHKKKFAKQPHAKHLSIWFSQKEVLAMLGISVPVICCHQLMPSSLLSRHEMSTFLRRIDVINPKSFLTTEGLEFPAIVGEWRRKTHRPAHFLHT
jgi:hypothetical protein